MRPIAIEQDILRYPLNELLGTRANVRLLRLLAVEHIDSVGTPEAAEQTGLTEAGARRALRKLVSSGIVEEFGGSRAQRFGLRHSARLAPALVSLFQAERRSYQELVTRLGDAFTDLGEIEMAWVDSAPTEPGQPLHVGLVSDVRSLAHLEQQVRQRVKPIEADYDLTIEIHTFSRADTPDVPWAHTLLLAGHVEESPREGGVAHADRLDRQRRLSALIADLLDRDAALVSRAIAHLDFLLSKEQGPARHDLREWRDILTDYPRHRLKEFLVSDAPRAQRLRQSSPFFPVLTPEQRDELLDAIEGAP